MANVKMTMRTFLEAVIGAEVSEEVTAFATERIKHLDEVNEHRKSRGSKTQRANVEIKAALLNALEKGVTYTAAEVVALEVDGITSTQKASALLRQLVEDNKLTATEVKIKGKGKVKGYTLTESED